MMKQLVAITVLALFVSGLTLAAPTWTFDSEDEIAGWSAWNQLDFAVANGVLRTESTGADPYFFPGGEWNAADWDPIDGATYSTIYLSVTVNMPSTWQIYYVTEEDDTWGEEQRQNFEMEAYTDFENVSLVMERGGWQERTVTRFRIDPGTEAGVITEIDYLSLESPATPVERQGKLAVTWATLKR